MSRRERTLDAEIFSKGDSANLGVAYQQNRSGEKGHSKICNPKSPQTEMSFSPPHAEAIHFIRRDEHSAPAPRLALAHVLVDGF